MLLQDLFIREMGLRLVYEIHNNGVEELYNFVVLAQGLQPNLCLFHYDGNI